VFWMPLSVFALSCVRQASAPYRPIFVAATDLIHKLKAASFGDNKSFMSSDHSLSLALAIYSNVERSLNDRPFRYRS